MKDDNWGFIANKIKKMSDMERREFFLKEMIKITGGVIIKDKLIGFNIDG